MINPTVSGTYQTSFVQPVSAVGSQPVLFQQAAVPPAFSVPIASQSYVSIPQQHVSLVNQTQIAQQALPTSVEAQAYSSGYTNPGYSPYLAPQTPGGGCCSFPNRTPPIPPPHIGNQVGYGAYQPPVVGYGLNSTSVQRGCC